MLLVVAPDAVEDDHFSFLALEGIDSVDIKIFELASQQTDLALVRCDDTDLVRGTQEVCDADSHRDLEMVTLRTGVVQLIIGCKKIDKEQPSPLEHLLEVDEVGVNRPLNHRLVIGDATFVETLAGQSADTWVHAVLYLQHRSSEATIEQSFEQRTAIAILRSI